MKRIALTYLTDWLHRPNRLPLILRGARQVGKTWLVRELASDQNLQLIELNIELNFLHAELFTSNDPALTIELIQKRLRISIDPQRALLFIDEIQEAPELLAKLRWFAELMSELPVIVAGSRLELSMSGSFPVGRVAFMYLEPFNFDEFLLAHKEEDLVRALYAFTWQTDIPTFLHEKLQKYFREYVLVGGMPGAVKTWVTQRSFDAVSQDHVRLIEAYRADFPRYAPRSQADLFMRILQQVPLQLGHKFVYSRVDPALQVATIKRAVDLVASALICHPVRATAANGLPLGAELKAGFSKLIMLDVGLCSSSLGLSLDQLTDAEDVELINKGALAEQVVGQMLRTMGPLYKESLLYYWLRTEKNAHAEVDYVIQHQATIVPVEVKAGATGALKSLHQFMGREKLKSAVRVCSDRPCKTTILVEDHTLGIIKYQLHSIPFYLVGHLDRLLRL